VAQTATTNSELQALNTLLAAEGLSTANIAQVDNVAQSLNDYNATDYATLVSQLEFAAQGHSPVATAANTQAATAPDSSLTTNLSTAAVVNDATVAIAVPKVSSAAAGLSKP
jgi:hypothetical protein